jgi:hypothetical protein
MQNIDPEEISRIVAEACQAAPDPPDRVGR